MLEKLKSKIHILQNIYLKNKYFIKKLNFSLEDNTLARLTKNIKNGFNVDVGAHHPLDQNNTHLLHKKGWHGINVDVNKFSIE